ncbi:uncharacterized protein Z518_03306 [Rhinocladiella mackenziei CBS 650.93]|uniref:Increased recombination centers protein 6 n=1 Tax=Rhinocladiella mackenziei CBS 650.93 TaxID=1442369 RepID=A0A0D2IRN4_9EURO|nr:uncharacterized protein Z518_03306 [Rhinocladiella mackenziei CBS 650.93]KIX08649.1 hypothetical protein Z518_03306 [Rhinocladiella mackenziei CBS 650.93]
MVAEPSLGKPSSLRLLILAPSSDPTTVPPFRNLLEAITGSSPSDEVTSFSGYTSHPPLSLRTKYYSSDVSIWCDELPSISTSSVQSGDRKEADSNPVEDTLALQEWNDQMLSTAAAEVRAVIGGILLILPISSLSSSSIPDSYVSFIEAVHSLREAVEDDSYGRDIASIILLQSMSSAVQQEKLSATMEKLEDTCLSAKGILGWDFVAWDGQTQNVEKEGNANDERNEYGEKTGIQRVIEVLEGIDWSASPNVGDDDGECELGELDGDDEEITLSPHVPGNMRFSGLDHELQREMMELKMSMLEDGDDRDTHQGAQARRDMPGDEDVQVEQLQGLMERVVAIREAGSEMPKAEREKFAKREIGRIMREIG